MSKNNKRKVEKTSDDINEFDDTDYGFIIKSNGSLRIMMLPEELMEDPPLEIKKILRIFGIKNIHQLESRTLH